MVPSSNGQGQPPSGAILRSWSGNRDYFWTVDQLLIDVDRYAATLEWTSFNRQHARIVRGVDWFVFEPQTLCIQEVRTYTASPVQPDLARQELLNFDYAGRGYPTTFPADHTR